MRRKGLVMEAVFTVGIMIFLGIAAFLSFGISGETIAGDLFGASRFPLVVIGIGLTLCALLLVKQLRAKKGKGEKLLDLSMPSGRAIAHAALALVVYLAVMNILGFILSTFLFCVAEALVMGYRKRGKLAMFAILATAGLFLLFGKAFFVPLPRGIGLLKEISYLLY